RDLIPDRCKLESDFPVEDLVPLAIREGNRKKPIYELHKWWARRLGSNFRMLILGALSSSRRSNATLWKYFYSDINVPSLTVFDPFMGGGTSIVEASKLGA